MNAIRKRNAIAIFCLFQKRRKTDEPNLDNLETQEKTLVTDSYPIISNIDPSVPAVSPKDTHLLEPIVVCSPRQYTDTHKYLESVLQPLNCQYVQGFRKKMNQRKVTQ